jgi:hypothetical protein
VRLERIAHRVKCRGRSRPLAGDGETRPARPPRPRRARRPDSLEPCTRDQAPASRARITRRNQPLATPSSTRSYTR